MPRDDYKNCRSCGEPSYKVGELSHTRLCVRCGTENLYASVHEQRNHEGPIFQRWRARIAASVGGALLDEVRERP